MLGLRCVIDFRFPPTAGRGPVSGLGLRVVGLRMLRGMASWRVGMTMRCWWS